MTDPEQRLGAVRDVPPPRPVAPVAVEETGLGRAARAVADAVTGLYATRSATTAATGLRDVVGAVAGAIGAALRREEPGERRAASAPGDGATTALDDLLAAVAPRLPVRDADRLRAAHPGASDDEIADALVARAARLTGRVGAAAGGLAAAHSFAPVGLLALPLEIGAETALVAAVELVLVGELHELYGRRPAGDARDRATAYLASWSARRAADRSGAAGLGSLGAAGLRAVRRRLTRRVVGSTPSATPFLVGAALGSRGNRRATETLAERLLADLRGPRRAPDDRG